jgi:hypothetical protein
MLNNAPPINRDLLGAPTLARDKVAAKTLQNVGNSTF